MSEMWETFDELWRALRRQGKRVNELETRLAQVEKDLQTRAETVVNERPQQFPRLARPVEKAA